ncbi:hypothetical protein BDQ12DRAFT_689064 [Crucibulum laeve]|uniref:Uncharacterized protein n=1 Tax=Crucibulum laeve TaxID=68775 RepID=A0A5C3LPH1_9AGAR|nr:hypothetical protein BDQ12DRAFT_689064 [Crucibulum laeve]
MKLKQEFSFGCETDETEHFHAHICTVLAFGGIEKDFYAHICIIFDAHIRRSINLIILSSRAPSSIIILRLAVILLLVDVERHTGPHLC